VVGRARLTDSGMTAVSVSLVFATAGAAPATETDRVGIPIGYPLIVSGFAQHRRNLRAGFARWPDGRVCGQGLPPPAPPFCLLISGHACGQ
jgi:hypothetical protein